jgi:molybdenum cofactor guanylyltransferase
LSAAGREPETEAAGFVLAGGRSSRMGRDKALLLLDGKPLVENALRILREAGLPSSIAGRSASARSPLASYAPLVADAEPGLGPLGGVCAALASTSAEHAIFLPVDAPLLPASLLVFLLRHARVTGRAVTVPSVAGFAQTFPAVLRRAVLPALNAELDAGRRGCFAAFQAAAAGIGEPVSVVAVELLAQAAQVSHPQAELVGRWFLNVNTPADLRRVSARGSALIA